MGNSLFENKESRWFVANNAIICIIYWVDDWSQERIMYTKIIIAIIGLMMVVTGYRYGYITDNKNYNLSPTIDNGIKVGQRLKSFTLSNIEGSSVRVAPAGKIIVINFWGSWCPLSPEEIVKLEVFTEKYQQKVDFYAVNLQKIDKENPGFMYENKCIMTVLVDKNGVVYDDFQVNSTPTTIIVNKHGIIKYRNFGAITGDELEGIVNSL